MKWNEMPGSCERGPSCTTPVLGVVFRVFPTGLCWWGSTVADSMGISQLFLDKITTGRAVHVRTPRCSIFRFGDVRFNVRGTNTFGLLESGKSVWTLQMVRNHSQIFLWSRWPCLVVQAVLVHSNSKCLIHTKIRTYLSARLFSCCSLGRTPTMWPGPQKHSEFLVPVLSRPSPPTSQAREYLVLCHGLVPQELNEARLEMDRPPRCEHVWSISWSAKGMSYENMQQTWEVWKRLVPIGTLCLHMFALIITSISTVW